MFRLYLGMLILGFLLVIQPVQAAIQTDFRQREIEAHGEGETAEAALEACEIQVLESLIQTWVQSESEQQKYQAFRPQLMKNRQRYLQRLQILGKGTHAQGGRYYHIRFLVAADDLRKSLLEAGIVLASYELTSEMRPPTIAVYYRDPREQSDYARWSIERVHHFLLQQAFKIVDLETWQKLSADDRFLSQSQGSVQRWGQLLGTQAHADILLEVEVQPNIAGSSGEYTYFQTPVRVKAYESSSGEPFIIKSYQRYQADGQPEALAIKGNVDISAKAVIEEAIAGVMPLMLEDLTRHWKENLSQGQQYRLIFKNLPVAKQALLTQKLKALVKDLKAQGNGIYLVRYAGPVADLADTIELQLGPLFALKGDAFDLGNASFVCQ